MGILCFWTELSWSYNQKQTYEPVASLNCSTVDYYEENEGSMVFMMAQWSSVWRVSRGVSNIIVMQGVWKSQCNHCQT